ncbi:MAG: tRNA (guanosine(37)-N1)-methyltransferase TrmD [Albidovulum sp.]|nr:tRNA (guanosine(37)-N1)-methyltransferase TrmD [Albidovulum sp.]MDE0534536.1 tRNA (guanosine(37)-N1)-methyltransferase TrmD [Albidovulum sp.]
MAVEDSRSVLASQSRESPSKPAWSAQVITLFPEAFPGALQFSLVGNALEAGIWSLETIDLREFGIGRHRQVDDTPAGGGAGMVLRPDVAAAAIEFAKTNGSAGTSDWPLVCLSPRGRRFDDAIARSWSFKRGVTLFSCRFEGIDQRVIDEFEIEEISLGDFVLSGGEIAAQALIDATVRLIPRVLGNQESAESESFSQGLLEYPQYTRPRTWRGRQIPETLVSGHHAKIAAWRQAQSEGLTRNRRPDLWKNYCASFGRNFDEDSQGNLRTDLFAQSNRPKGE